MRFEDMSKNVEIAVADVVDFWNSKYPRVITRLENFQFDYALDEVQKVIASTEFKILLEAVLEFPRAIWEEFDIDEFVQMNKFIFAEIYQKLNDFVDSSASNSQTFMIEEYGSPLVY